MSSSPPALSSSSSSPKTEPAAGPLADAASTKAAVPTISTTLALAQTQSFQSPGSADSDDDFPTFDDFRARGQVPSSFRRSARTSFTIKIDETAPDMRRTQSASASTASNLSTKTRGRSLSPSPAKVSLREPSPAPSAGLDASWWGSREDSNLPWKEQPRRKHTIQVAEVQGYEHTKQRVALAVRSCLGNVVDVGQQLLIIGVDLLDLVPIPGLAPAAKTLLNIWEAVEGVDVNVNGCLRLAERCADLLIAIRQEVREAGDMVELELRAPISKLEDTFVNVLEFMQKQIRRPFLKRFLKRDEILIDIAACDAGLRDALSLFGLSVQIRILKQLQENERQRQKDTRDILNTISSGLVAVPSSNEETIAHFITSSNALGLSGISTPPLPDSDTILPTLANLQASENSIDRTTDLVALRALMHRAIQTSSDADMIDILQVKHEQMPDAIKTLQRALENVVEKRRSQSPVDAIPPGVVISKVKRRVSRKDLNAGGLQRSTTFVSIESTTSTHSTADTSASGSGRRTRPDTLEQEFIETGLSALVRMSQGQNTNLPSWTITKFEINREKRVGVGGFSDVYRGTWKGRTVAIKVLKLETEKRLFVREVEIWKTLRHEHVLELYGASSAIEPPWFLVSPYQKHGSLVDYLRKLGRELYDTPGSPLSAAYLRQDRTPRKTATMPLPIQMRNRTGALTPPTPSREVSLASPSSASPKTPLRDSPKIRPEWDILRFMHEIAKGMAYLHSHDVLHGDMKAANVLIDDNYHCVITDFGQSEMKSTAFRLTGKQPARGTLRWQAPEILQGDSELTREADVYAFAIACVEIINMGKLPWGSLLEDETIRNMVLKENSRPSVVEDSRFYTPSLQEILRICWHRDPTHRPPFSKLSRDFKILRQNFKHEGETVDTPIVPLAPLPEEDAPYSPSPDMRPVPLPPLDASGSPIDIFGWSSQDDYTASPSFSGLVPAHVEETVTSDTIRMPEAVFFTSAQVNNPSIHTVERDDEYDDDFERVDLDFYPVAALVDANTAAVWNERRYRLLLTHDFHPSLVLPLWQPGLVELGAVGYLQKPEGRFITLFNALKPQNSEGVTREFGSIHGYGDTSSSSHSQDKRSITQKGWDSIAGLLSRSRNGKKDGDIPISRRYTFPLKAGHGSAHLFTQTTRWVYMKSLQAPRKWFKAYIRNIMNAYPHIQREDFCLVVGHLEAANHGLFVSHNHPDGHVHFNVHKTAKGGQPWGTFTTDNMAQTEHGPYDDTLDTRARIEASKVSSNAGTAREPWDTVLISRLRFRADGDEPTWKL